MRSRSIGTSFFLTLATLVGWSGSSPAQCLEWDSGFALPGPNDAVYVLRVLDDGTGPELYAGGQFTKVDGMPANHVAKWDGSTWSALGPGIDGGVFALAVYDDGSGPAIYAGGTFATAGGASANNIAKWNGSTWTPLGIGTDDAVSALAVFDDGSGSALYAGGGFTTAGGVSTPSIAKWNGSTWTSVGGGANGGIAAIELWDDGSGLALYVSGYFTTAGAVSAANIAKWNGSTWSALGSGVTGGAYALAVWDDGSGEALYAGGDFDTAGGSPANLIAKWDGFSWSALAGGPVSYFVESISVHDDGSGPSLYASGGGARVDKWDGSTWSTIELSQSGLCVWRPLQVYTLTSFDDGSGPSLYVGTSITSIPDAIRDIFLGKWHNATWSLVGNSQGVGGEICGISALLPYDLGTKPSLIAGGNFSTTGDLSVNSIASWDGSKWTALGEGVKGEVRALAVFDPGPDPGLFAGGLFKGAGGTSANNIARWNGTDWGPVGLGTNGPIAALAVYDDGSGPALFAGGHFWRAGDVGASSIARWDGISWSPLGAGIDGYVYALTVFDDGEGPALFAGGQFTSAGGKGVHNIAKWNGSDWSPLEGGVSGEISALTVFDDGGGPALFAGGAFNSAGAMPAFPLAKWEGSSWSYPPFGGCLGGRCTSLAVFDDGSGPALYAGGTGYGTGGPVSLCKWDGRAQMRIADFYAGYPAISALTVAQVGTASNPDLYVGGEFRSAETTPSVGLARWIGCGHPGVDFCYGDGSSAACPCLNNGSAGHGCENSHSTGGALLDTSGWTSLNFDSLKLTSSGELQTALTIFLQGASEIAPAPYGDGLRCAGGVLKRLFVKSAVGGIVSIPQPIDPSVSDRSAALGDPIFLGATRIYQAFYRDPRPAFCPEPVGSTWNASNAVRIGWLP